MASSTVFMKRNDTRPHLDVVLSDVDGLPIDLSVSEIDQSNIKFTMIDAESSNIKIDSTNTTLLSADDGGAVGSDGKIRYTWVSADTDTAGVYLGEFQILYDNGDKLTIPTNGVLTIVILEDYDNA